MASPYDGSSESSYEGNPVIGSDFDISVILKILPTNNFQIRFSNYEFLKNLFLRFLKFTNCMEFIYDQDCVYLHSEYTILLF